VQRHLDTAFTFADRDCVLLYPDIVNNITAYSYRPSKSWRVELWKDDKPFVDVIAESLGLKKLRVVGTGGNAYMRERTQGDSRPNLVCVSPALSLHMIGIHIRIRHRGYHDRWCRIPPRPTTRFDIRLASDDSLHCQP
jgi:hypothetical protein